MLTDCVHMRGQHRHHNLGEKMKRILIYILLLSAWGPASCPELHAKAKVKRIGLGGAP